ncbi:MAG: FtsH protease activity modulator HflK [Chloroflexi bacterium]|nr:FtsH protease activity modulator HflK [Chloroflexota bacterium]
MSSRNEPVPYEDLRSYRPPSDRGGGNRGGGSGGSGGGPPRPGGGGLGGGGGPEQVSLEDIINRIRDGLPNWGGKQIGGGLTAIVILIALVSVGIWLATGIYTVGPDQQGLLRTWGKFDSTTSQGLHFHWPSPIGTRNVESVTQTRRLEVGFRSGADGLGIAQTVGAESLMITGDENIVDVQMVVQYRISSLRDFVFNVADPGDPDRNIGLNRPEGRTLRDAAESSLRQVVGSRDIDDVLTVGKEQVQAETALIMDRLLDSYGAGLEIIAVLLQNVNPPEEVRPAFEDVVKAREDRERLINLAEAYRADQLPRAEGRAAQIVESAEGFKEGRIAKAQGEAAGFKELLEGYENSKVVTRQRLYLEAMEEILPGITKFIITEDTTSGVLPFLPLTGGTAAPAAAAAAAGGTN